MGRPDETGRKLAKEWFARAEEDLGVASCLLAQSVPFASAIGFHAQQAVEKYLKSFLVYHQMEFTKTHDIAQLLDLVATKGPELAEMLCDAVALTPYAVEARYPGDAIALTVAEAEEAIATAQEARKAISAELNL